MKRFLVLLPLLLCLISAHAQDSESPYTFKGIPIEGTTDNFIKQLVSQGFKIIKNNSPLQNNFSKDCLFGTFFNRYVTILLSENSPNSINGVYILLDTDNLDSTISSYKDARNGLKTKYGNSKDFIFFDTKSIEGKSLSDIKRELVSGETFSAGIAHKKQDSNLLYISLVLSNGITTLTYMNPQIINTYNYYNDL